MYVELGDGGRKKGVNWVRVEKIPADRILRQPIGVHDSTRLAYLIICEHHVLDESVGPIVQN